MSATVPVPAQVGRANSIVNRTMALTPLRTVATRAIQLAEDERSAVMDLATVLSSDQALTARVLRVANSAYYGYPRRISNVRDAVVLLGMRTVRSVITTAGVIETLSAPDLPGFSQELFWAHSICVGLVAEAVARATSVARPEDAFTAGVIHDIGKLAMIITEPKAFAQVIDLQRAGSSYHAAENAVFGIGHQVIGAQLAERWRFPAPLVSAIRNHHPASSQATVASLDDVVAVANIACNRDGLACGFDLTEAAPYPHLALPPRVEEIIAGLPHGMGTIEERGLAFLRNVTTRAPAWYASSSIVIEDEPVSVPPPAPPPGTRGREAA